MKLDATFKMLDTAAPDFGSDHVQVAKFQRRSYVAGPGPRCVVWVSGCLRRCPGCFQSQFFDFQTGTKQTVESVAQEILSVGDVDGVTFSGGEPFEQPAALAKVCKIIRRESTLSILAYTGYRAVDLLEDLPRYGQLLDHLDILIDGEYRADESGPFAHRGSGNQRIIRRSNAAEIQGSRSRQDFDEHDRPEPNLGQTHDTELHPSEPAGDIGEHEIQLAVDDRSLVLSGFPPSDVDVRLRAALRKRGILLGRAESGAGRS